MKKSSLLISETLKGQMKNWSMLSLANVLKSSTMTMFTITSTDYEISIERDRPTMVFWIHEVRPNWFSGRTLWGLLFTSRSASGICWWTGHLQHASQTKSLDSFIYCNLGFTSCLKSMIQSSTSSPKTMLKLSLIGWTAKTSNSMCGIRSLTTIKTWPRKNLSSM